MHDKKSLQAISVAVVVSITAPHMVGISDYIVYLYLCGQVPNRSNLGEERLILTVSPGVTKEKCLDWFTAWVVGL